MKKFLVTCLVGLGVIGLTGCTTAKTPAPTPSASSSSLAAKYDLDYLSFASGNVPSATTLSMRVVGNKQSVTAKSQEPVTLGGCQVMLIALASSKRNLDASTQASLSHTAVENLLTRLKATNASITPSGMVTNLSEGGKPVIVETEEAAVKLGDDQGVATLEARVFKNGQSFAYVQTCDAKSNIDLSKQVVINVR